MLTKKRRYPGIPKKELKKSCKTIVNYFGKEWLKETDNHPLKILWNRTDPLSTNELLTFGSSLLSIKDKNKRLEDNIKKIKSENLNNVIGAVFEVISAAMIENGENQELEIPRKDNPGYDLTILLKDKSRINVSCKNYGISKHNQNFYKLSKEFEKAFLKSCEELKIKNVQCFIYTTIHPEFHWNLLKSEIHSILEEVNIRNSLPVTKRINNWHIQLSKIPENEQKFSNEHISYSVLLLSPLHKNERNRLYFKLNDACDNLSKHGIKQNNNQINVIFVKLPQLAPLDECEKWSEEYLENNPDKSISGIIFLQPAIKYDPSKKKLQLVYLNRFIKNKNYDLWFSSGKNRQITFKIPVGKVIDENLKRTIRDINDSFKEFEIKGMDVNKSYAYQSGKHYIDANKSRNVRIGSPAPGIHRYSVTNSIIKKLDLQPDDRLILL